jgi:integrase
MSEKVEISERIVAALSAPKIGNKVYFFSGAKLQGKTAPPGFGVRVTKAGAKQFVLFYRVNGKKHLDTVGAWDESPKGGELTVRAAIIAAADRMKAIRDGADPRPERTRRKETPAEGDIKKTVSIVCKDFVERHVEKDAKLRSADAIKSAFERLVKPTIGDVCIYDLRRLQVMEMLDRIADENGPVMADRTLAMLRKAFNWHMLRDDNFQSPIVKGMAKTKPKERARDRTLSDQELRDLWTALDEMDGPSCYPRYIRTLFLTATRREEASAMSWEEIDGEDWTIPAARYKTAVDHLVPLTDTVLKLIGERQKNTKKTPFVFSTTDGELPFSGYGKAKDALDKKIAEIRRDPMPAWTLHDLRRTARTLMSRAGVATDIAERVLGHLMPGVRGVYDRYAYKDEKREALARLAALVELILALDGPALAQAEKTLKRAAQTDIAALIKHATDNLDEQVAGVSA